MKSGLLAVLLFFALTCTAPLSAQNGESRPYDLAWSPDGALIAISGEGYVRVWSSDTQKLLLDLSLGGDEIVSKVTWSPDSTKLAGLTVSVLRVWNISVSQSGLVATIYSEFPLGDLFSPRDAAWSPNGQYIAVSGLNLALSSGITLIWDVATRQILGDRNRLVGEQTVMWTPDSESLVIGQHDEGPFIVAAFDTVIKHTDPNPERTTPIPAYFFAWSHDGHQIAIGYVDGIIVVRDLAANSQVSYLDTHTNSPVSDLVWTPDNRVLAIVFTPETRELWDVFSGKLLRTIQIVEGYRVNLSPDGNEIVLISNSTTIDVQPALVSP